MLKVSRRLNGKDHIITDILESFYHTLECFHSAAAGDHSRVSGEVAPLLDPQASDDSKDDEMEMMSSRKSVLCITINVLIE